jgi:hypothetical protein
MPRLLLCLAILLPLVGCTTPKPSGNTLVSISWQNPSPATFRFAEASLGDGTRPVVVEEVPPYAEPVAPTAIALSTHPRVDLVFQFNGQTQPRRTMLIPPPTRRDPQNEYHLRLRFVQTEESWQLVSELEPAGIARERLKRLSPPPN